MKSKEFNIQDYTGVNILDVLSDENAKQTYRYCTQYMHENYGDNVDYQHMLRQVLLCDATRDYLYGSTPAPVRYVPGTRPYLEGVLEGIIKDCTTDREKFLAILRYVRDNYKSFGGEHSFFGGTEEDLIKKGEWGCEHVARLMIGLCEIAGFPGRIVFHIAAGHITSEIYVEGKWAYVDPRCGLFYLWEDGRFMSVDELVRNRDRIYHQDHWVYDYQNPYWSIPYRQHRNYHFCLSPLEINCFTDYSLMDADTYGFQWKAWGASTSRASASNKSYVEYGLMTLIR